MPATGGTSVRGLGANSGGHTGVVGTHGLSCQLLEPVGSWCQLLESLRFSTSSHWGGNTAPKIRRPQSGVSGGWMVHSGIHSDPLVWGACRMSV